MFRDHSNGEKVGTMETWKVRFLIILGTYMYLNFDEDHVIPNVHVKLTLTMHQLTGLQSCILYLVIQLPPDKRVEGG